MNRQTKPAEVIVYGHYPPPITGERLCCLYLIERLRAQGHEVEAATKRDGLALSTQATFAWMILGSHGAGFWRDCVIALKQRRPRRLYLYIHNASWRRLISFAWLLRPLVGHRVTCVVLTAAIAERLKQAGWKAVVLRNTTTATELSGLTVPPAQKRLMWMAAISEEKGFIIAYAAFGRLRRSEPEWVFDVYGTGLSSAAFPLARFHGVVAGEAKRAAFALGGIMLLPSRYLNETQPLCLLEAMSVGVPIVTSSVGGITEIVGQGEQASGIAVQKVSPETIATAIENVHAQAVKFEIRARGRFGEFFSSVAFDRVLAALMQSE